MYDRVCVRASSTLCKSKQCLETDIVPACTCLLATNKIIFLRYLNELNLFRTMSDFASANANIDRNKISVWDYFTKSNSLEAKCKQCSKIQNNCRFDERTLCAPKIET